MEINKSIIRRSVQILFMTVVIFMGIKFYLFVSYLEKGIIPDFVRPPGVEAFLPISALVSLKHWVYTGTINTIHPSALILFLIICFTALVAKKGFCSWVCPIGLVSEYLVRLRLRAFRINLKLPHLLDGLLRSLKYLIAGFFIYQVFYKMPISSIEYFIQSPYNRFADIKMLRFFTQISNTALMVLLGLLVLSVFIKHFWCRYLCPYGALLGLIGFFSLGRVNRNPSQCSRCGKCEKQCPGNIAIRQKTRINSLECSACLTCVDTCPEKNAIKYSLFANSKPVTSFFLALFFVLVFTGGITLAKLTGNWQNEISKQEYSRYTAPVSHNSRVFEQIDPEKMQRMILMMQQFKKQGRIHMPDLQKQKGE